MESTDDIAGSFIDTMLSQLSVSASYLPSLLMALLILVLGWFIARVLRRIVRKLAATSNRLLERVFPSGILAEARVSSLTVTLIGEFVFWATLLIALTLAARMAELSSISQGLNRITAHLPHLIAGLTIVVIGYLLSVYLREQFAPTMTSEDSQRDTMAGRTIQASVIAIALIVALDQIGIDVALLVALAVVVVAALLIALSVAFALGARSHVSNLIGIRTARTQLRNGMTIQIGDVTGEILEIALSQITLETDRGRVLVPGRLLDDAMTCVLNPESEQDDHNV